MGGREGEAARNPFLAAYAAFAAVRPRALPCGVTRRPAAPLEATTLRRCKAGQLRVTADQPPTRPHIHTPGTCYARTQP